MVTIINQVTVTGERIIFAKNISAYELKNRNVTVILSVVGTKNSKTYTFKPNQDYYLNQTSNTLVWITGGAQPDNLTSFFVDYVYIPVPTDIPFTDEQYGRDILLQPNMSNTSMDLVPSPKGDLQTVVLTDNLMQALKIKLSLIKGYLKQHPLLGSELFNMVGTNMTNENLELVKLYVIEALNEDPRVSEIDSIDVKGDRLMGKVSISVNIIPIGSHEPLNLVYDFFVDDVNKNYL